jgi:hypothetical protein
MWCRSLFPVPRYGVATSNTIEIVFSTFRRIKHLPVLHLMLFIERYILKQRFSAFLRLKEMKEAGTVHVHKAIELLNEETQFSTNLKCFQTDLYTATFEEKTARGVQEFSCNVQENYCSCNRFQESGGIPCRHAICFLRNVIKQTR